MVHRQRGAFSPNDLVLLWQVFHACRTRERLEPGIHEAEQLAAQILALFDDGARSEEQLTAALRARPDGPANGRVLGVRR